MERSWLRRAAGAAAVVAIAAGCATAGPAGVEGPREELDRARRLWAAEGMDDYRYTLRRICFCLPEVGAPVEVEVRDGAVVARRAAGSGAPVGAEHQELWPAVEGLFDLVEDAVEREADRVAVTYHPERGYPTSVYIDYSFEMADEELGFEVEAPAALP